MAHSSIVFGLPFLALSSWLFSQTPSTHSTPQEISDFYQDLNHVSSFSTPTEREMLRSVESLNYQSVLENPRLMEMADRLMRIDSRILQMDPAFVRKYSSPSYSDRDSFSRDVKPVQGPGQVSPQLFWIEPTLYEITDVKGSGHVFSVEVTCYQIPPETNLKWVAEYEKDELPEVSERIRSAGGVVLRSEIHRWSRTDGRWLVSNTRTVLTGRSF